MTKRKRYAVIALMIVGVIGALIVWHNVITAQRIREIDGVLRDLGQALQEQDYERARSLCSSDFKPIPGGVHFGDEKGATDEHLAKVAGLINAPPCERPILDNSYGGDTVSYLPSAGGSWPIYYGEYYDFKRENGRWKFTGEYGNMCD